MTNSALAEATQSYHHGNLRRELLKQALEHLKQVGPDKISLRALARDIGVSQTAPYRHFPDKNALLAALAAHGHRQLTEVTQAAVDAAEDDAQKFIDIGLAYIDFARANPELYKLMFGPVLESPMEFPELVEAGQRAFAMILTVIQEGINRKHFVQDDARILANGAWSMVHGIASLWIDGMYRCADGTFPSDETHLDETVIANSLKLLVNGILYKGE